VQFHILLLSLSHGNRALKTNFTELPILTVNYKNAVHMSVPDITTICNARYSHNRRLHLEETQTADSAIGLCAVGPSVIIFNKNSITSDAATCRKKRTRSQGSRKPLSQWMALFIDGHQKQGWVGAGDSFERRMADVAESFVNRRVQFCQLMNAAQIIYDSNKTDNEQVSCAVYKDKPSIWINGFLAEI